MKRKEFWLFTKNEKRLLLLVFGCLCLSFTWRHVMSRPIANNLIIQGDSTVVRVNSKYFKQTSNGSHSKKYDNQGRKAIVLQKVELNSADSAQLEALPLIGSKLAMRIIKYRDRLGGFYAVEQLKEVYGLRDSCFLVIQNRVFVDSATRHFLKINHCTLEELGRHPYFGFRNSKLILKYRKEHQRINSEQELYEIQGLHFESGEKWRFYLTYQ
jgi:competence protein ComEA